MSGNGHLQADEVTGSWSYPGGATIALHRHPQHQLLRVVSGLLEVHTPTDSFMATPDRAVWIPCGTAHHHRVVGRTRLQSLAFPVDGAGLEVSQPTVLAVDRLAGALIAECCEASPAPAQDRRLRAVLLDRLVVTVPTVPPLPIPRDPRVAQACRLVLADLTQAVPIEELAAAVHTSRRTLTRSIKDDLGLTYPQWRTRARLQAALRLLADGESVTRTATSCGWATPSAFIDTFSRATGRTPGQYRGSLDPHRSDRST